MRIKEATWTRNFLLGNQLGLKLIHHRLHATFQTQELSGKKRFSIGEFLTPQQIKSYFSRKAAKTKQVVADEEARELAQKHHQTYSSVRETIIRECHIEHPIMCDTFDVCKLYSEGKLTKLKVASLLYFLQYGC